MEYLGDEPQRLDTVVISTQHLETTDIEDLRREVTERVIRPGLRDLHG